MADDSPDETLTRLKKASDALDAAQNDSDIGAQEIARDERTVADAKSLINGIHKPTRKPKRR